MEIEIPRIYYQRDPRGFHTQVHIESMFDKLYGYEFKLIREQLSPEDIQALEHAILYHDICHDALCMNNEERSCFEYARSKDYNSKIADKVKDLILVTSNPSKASTLLEKIMSVLDHSIFFSLDKTDIYKYCDQIFYEYQCMPFEQYKKERRKVLIEIDRYLKPILSSLIEMRYIYNSILDIALLNIQEAIRYEEARKPRIGVYVGSFKPFHIGHYDILKKAEKVFDKVIVIQIVNSKNKGIIEHSLPAKINNRECYTVFSNDTLPSILSTVNIGSDYTLIRGIRSGHDLIAEQNYAQTIKDIGVKNPIIHILSSRETQHVSSTLVRELLSLDDFHEDKYLV